MEDNDKKISQWLEGELSEDELSKDVPQEDIAAYKQILGEVDLWDSPSKQEDLSMDVILSSKEQKETKVRVLRWWQLSAAACILLLMIAGIWWANQNPYTVHAVSQGNVQEITLPDGESRVFVAGGSKVRWLADDWNTGKRELILEGKGFFDVAGGGSFKVMTQKGSVEVLGTEFEVSDFTEEFRVSCYEGKVRASAGEEIIILAQGEESRFRNGKWVEISRTKDVTSPWLSDKNTFDNVPFQEVVTTLEKVYDVQVVNSTPPERRYSGTFPSNDLDLAVAVISEAMNIQVEIRGDTLQFSQ